MNAERSDFDRALRTWFEDGPTVMPDRVVDGIAGRIARQPQRRNWRLRGRPFMNSYAKLAAAAAAILVVAFVGWQLLPGNGGFGGNPTPAPTDSGAPTAAPVPTMPDGSMAPGTYFTTPITGSPLKVTFEAPGGWHGFGPWGLIGPDGTLAPNGIGIGFLTAEGLFSDPCHWDIAGDGRWPQAGDVAAGTTVEELVAALGANDAYTATAPVDVVIGGYTGKRVDLELPADVTTGCDVVGAQSGSGGISFVWGTTDAAGNGLYIQGPNQRWQVNVVDVAGTRLIVVIDDYPTTPQASRDAAQAIVDSIELTP
jgi:hypothetical protein